MIVLIPLFGFMKKVLQIQEQLLICRGVDESCGNARLSTAARAANLMDVIFNFFGHRVIDNMLDSTEIETLSE